MCCNRLKMRQQMQKGLVLAGIHKFLSIALVAKRLEKGYKNGPHG